MKLEGGTSAPREIGIDVTETNSWQEYAFDFSAFDNENFRSLTIFTNAGTDAPGVIYYFDDIRLEAAPPVVAFEDFEGATPFLFWQPANGNSTVNGTFQVIDNPDVSGLNETSRVGEHVKGSSMLSTLVALAADPLDLSVNSQLNMLLWAPAGSMTVRLTAVSTSEGRLEIDRDITATEEWIEVGFNLEEFADAGDVSRLEFVFDPSLGGSRTYYFDELSLGSGTIDPCEGTEPVMTTIDDFECQRNATLTNGADDVDIVDNPDTGGNPSATVGQYTRPAGAGSAFSNISYEFSEPLDLEVFNRVRFDLWSPEMVPIVLKFENSANGSAAVETAPFMVTETNSWQTYTVDLSAAAGGEFQRLVIFLNFNTEPATEDVYYLDNIQLRRGPVTACITDYETANTSITDFRGFAGGSTNDDAFAVVDNPDPSGANTSPTVGRFLESADGESFAGIFTPFGAPVLFPNPANKTISMLVWSPDVIDFVMKLEGSTTGAQGTGDVFPVAQYSTPGEWQELTWDFTDFDTDAAQFETFTLIPGIGETPAALRTIYFDAIAIGDAACANVSDTRTPRREITALQAWPNPSNDVVHVSLPAESSRILVLDALGRVVQRQVIGASYDGQLTELSLGHLPRGMYTVFTQSESGQALGRVRISLTK